MNAYLIDPFEKTITRVEHNGDFKEIYTLIGARAFDAARFSENGDAVFVDDEGLLGDLSKQAFFLIKGYTSPLAGKGLVLGVDMKTGNSISPKTDFETVKNTVLFATLGDLVLMGAI